MKICRNGHIGNVKLCWCGSAATPLANPHTPEHRKIDKRAKRVARTDSTTATEETERSVNA